MHWSSGPSFFILSRLSRTGTRYISALQLDMPRRRWQYERILWTTKLNGQYRTIMHDDGAGVVIHVAATQDSPLGKEAKRSLIIVQRTCSQGAHLTSDRRGQSSGKLSCTMPGFRVSSRSVRLGRRVQIVLFSLKSFLVGCEAPYCDRAAEKTRGLISTAEIHHQEIASRRLDSIGR